MLFSPFITFKYRVSRRFGQDAGGPRLFPTRTKARLYDASEEGTAPPDELSYEDALLDAQLRLFMRADFEGVEPPAGQYAQVERLISQDKEADGSLLLPSLPFSSPFLPPSDLPTSPFRGSRPSGRFYRLLTGTASSRLLPGGIALALMMMVLGANASQLLRGAPPTPVVDVVDIGDASPILLNPTWGNHVAAQPASMTDIVIPDPREILPKRPPASAPAPYRETVPMPGLVLSSQ